MVMVNPSYAAVTVTIEPGYSTIAGRQDRRINQGSPVTSIKLSGKDGVVLVKNSREQEAKGSSAR